MMFAPEAIPVLGLPGMVEGEIGTKQTGVIVDGPMTVMIRLMLRTKANPVTVGGMVPEGSVSFSIHRQWLLEHRAAATQDV